MFTMGNPPHRNPAYPSPSELALEASKIPDWVKPPVLEDYAEVCRVLLEKKNMTWPQIAAWLTERGIVCTASKIRLAYNKYMTTERY